MQLVAPEIKSIQDRYEEIFDERSSQAQNERGSDGCVPAGRNQSRGKLPAHAGTVPNLDCVLPDVQGSIELRHAPWIGWVHDLSAKDPYYILPIAMVISSYLMTKMTPMPTTTDPAQQKMMLLMPVFMGFIFFNLSSGLNLYYFTSNLGNVAQQWYLNRTHPLPSRSKFKKNRE